MCWTATSSFTLIITHPSQYVIPLAAFCLLVFPAILLIWRIERYSACKFLVTG